MGNHPFNVIVVLFWLATMSWLVVAKVLPPLRVGEPPSYRSILDQSQKQLPICWNIRLQDKSIGWAANRVERRPDGITELVSRVYLKDVPLDRFAPPWLGKVLRSMLGRMGPLDIDKTSRMVVDPLGRLVGFESRLKIADIPDAIKLQGQIDGATLHLAVQSGEVSCKLEQALPPNALVADELSPQTRLPGLRVGQTWTMPLYSPFSPPTSPIEILAARVEQSQQFSWAGKPVLTRVVVYRSDAGAGLGSGEVRGRMWVREDGLVLAQEIVLLRSRFQFVRLSDERCRKSRQCSATTGALRLIARPPTRSCRQPAPTLRPTGNRHRKHPLPESGRNFRMLQIENVTRSFGSKVAVSNLSLEIPSGQLFAFLGPNGAGKTTTIKMIVGLLRPSAGTIRLCGHDVTASDGAANRLLGYVPDVPYLYDKLTGREFLQFIAEMYGLVEPAATRKILDQIALFELADFVDDLTESYSHGMKQRLAFAAALLHEPRVLVIDEPMVGLDPKSVRLVKDLLRATAAAGQTIFMSTHLLAIAEEIADRVGIVDRGQLQFLGTIDELRHKLANRDASLEQLYLRFTGAAANAATAPTEAAHPGS